VGSGLGTWAGASRLHAASCMKATPRTLWGASAAAAWPVAAAGWWPAPRTVEAASANCVLTLGRCSGCGTRVARLQASSMVAVGSELTVSSAAHVLTPPVPFAYEVTFDGGAREVAGRRVAGAAAILWGPGRNQPMAQLAVATVKLPHVSRAPEAEAWGGTPCTHLVAEGDGETRTARVSGDNLAVVRFCAATARLRGAEHQQLLERPLADLHLRGWGLSWLAVPRRMNMAADSLATEAIRRATTLPAERGLDIVVHWAGDA